MDLRLSAVPGCDSDRAVPKATRLSHLDAAGRARMVDVSRKAVTEREAVARGRVRMRASTMARIATGDLPKGDVLTVARLAGVMAAKRTADLFPLWHPLALTHVEVTLAPDAAASCVHIESRVRVRGRTGVEMEALTAACVAALTLYDMCKGVDRDMVIDDVCLVRKRGGRSGTYVRRS
jgi:cyclic pyranopterin phosphate synthase